jgi:dipeptidyl aminopeptidase/acylaminoacyl peptidase
MAAHPPPFTVDTLWQLQRLGPPSLSPDGAQAVVAVQRGDMAGNRMGSQLWLLSTLGGEPRALTHGGDKDSAPQWSPRGDRIAFLSRREQQGQRDAERQLYLIAPDGGEASRAATVASGVEAFRWFPDGRRIAFIAWVWPDERGPKAQSRRLQAWRDRQETGHATEEAIHRWWDRVLPPGRVPHLHVLDLGNGRVRDLFEGTALTLSRSEAGAHSYAISPDGQRIAFAHDPAPAQRLENRLALSEIDVRSGAVRPLIHEPAWHIDAPAYSPDGGRIACLASHRGLKHTMPAQLAVWDAEGDGGRGDWAVESAQWDHVVEAPLVWEDDGQALLFTAEERGAKPLWRFDLPDRRAERIAVAEAPPARGAGPTVAPDAGWVAGFDKRAGCTVVHLESARHPAQAWALLPGEPARRIERFNADLLDHHPLGASEAVTLRGALGDPVQLRLVYPPGFDTDHAQPHPVMLLLHGGPHSVFGDNWHWRWNAHVFAAAGHVVACLNYHGSSGFGHAFLDSITHRWGTLELQDIEAATDWLRAQPWTDARRLHAVGGSYGGFLTAWMNAHARPERYAAYVCHAGCYDWQAMWADDACAWHAQELGAAYWDDPVRVAEQSPATYAAAMQTPTLITHGAQDQRVPDAQGLAFYNTLKARGVPARLLWFPDEHHWVEKPRNSRQWYREVIDWLARHALPG